MENQTVTWTRKDRTVRTDAHCIICGDYYGICQGEHRAHRPSTCKACGTPQCWTRGLARGQCSVCYIGLLDAFSTRKCGYAGCNQEAVSAALRVKYACKDHLDKPYTRGKTTRQYISELLANRDKAWEQVTFNMREVPVL